MSAYQNLEAIFRRHSALGGAASILGWDNATMLPANAGEVRGEQMAALAEAAHELMNRPELADWFATAQSEALDDWQRANLREMERNWRHETAVPVALVSALVKASQESELFWRQARKDNDFAAFRPHQERVLALVYEAAQAKAAAFGISAYDALLDQYDPGMTTAMLEPIFSDLAAFLPDFIARARAHQATLPPPLEIKGKFPLATQQALGRRFMETLGFDFTRGRLDESAHPFCGGVPGDVRLTTHYREDDFLPSFFGVLHETGHALYEMGLPAQWRNQPVGFARGMATHESQSLLVEMQLALSHDFLHYAAPLIRQAFNVSGPEWSPENIRRLVTRVKPGFIRVHSDEATYPAHIILRYRLEKAMIEGKLEIKDLPEAWREQMQSLLGITPDSDANGCMQDIHWPDGTFGYFPSYTIGAMMAAQFYAAANKAIPDLGSHLRSGEFTPLFDWLRTHVHSLGSKLSTPELLRHATGQTLNVDIYKAHLETRYLH